MIVRGKIQRIHTVAITDGEYDRLRAIRITQQARYDGTGCPGYRFSRHTPIATATPHSHDSSRSFRRSSLMKDSVLTIVTKGDMDGGAETGIAAEGNTGNRLPGGQSLSGKLPALCRRPGEVHVQHSTRPDIERTAAAALAFQ